MSNLAITVAKVVTDAAVSHKTDCEIFASPARSEAKKAGKYGSDEYWQIYVRAYIQIMASKSYVSLPHKGSKKPAPVKKITKSAGKWYGKTNFVPRYGRNR